MASVVIVALDVGRRRIGMAIAEGKDAAAYPLGTIERRSFLHDAAAIKGMVRMWGVNRIVVGLPINMDGTEGESARMARAFAKKIEDALGIAVEMFDERLTSFEAEDRLRASGSRGRRDKATIDAVAAAVILEGWLESQRRNR